MNGLYKVEGMKWKPVEENSFYNNHLYIYVFIILLNECTKTCNLLHWLELQIKENINN